MAERMGPNEKAAVVVELGLVRLTQFDTEKRVAGADVAARNLDTAQVRFTRRGGCIQVPVCVHASRDGEIHNHECEGHANGHVCYHARAALMFAAQVAGATVTFHKTADEARATGGKVAKVMVPGHDGKAVYAAYKKS